MLSLLIDEHGISFHLLRSFFFFYFYLFIYLWLCWVFVSVRGLPLVAANGGHSSSRYAGLSLSRPLLLRSTGSRRAGSAIVAQGPSRSAACGIFLDQGLNPCPLHWQADSQPLHHQGSPLAHSYYNSWSLCLECFSQILRLACHPNLCSDVSSSEGPFLVPVSVPSLPLHHLPVLSLTSP